MRRLFSLDRDQNLLRAGPEPGDLRMDRICRTDRRKVQVRDGRRWIKDLRRRGRGLLFGSRQHRGQDFFLNILSIYGTILILSRL